MLDPKEQKKGGFRAFAERDTERRAADEAARAQAARDDATGTTADTPAGVTASKEKGTPSPAAAPRTDTTTDRAR